ncbi:hypothetical protein [Exilibacterium tricleocarpae]|uniref:hypothetical protein n=1 Tax=Exilibacterium tricleocarpae TaxID=2591008 RepID=UPI0015D45DC0|nr:hypothetical protein [Exilibacterium tricleocarpae]
MSDIQRRPASETVESEYHSHRQRRETPAITAPVSVSGTGSPTGVSTSGLPTGQLNKRV